MSVSQEHSTSGVLMHREQLPMPREAMRAGGEQHYYSSGKRGIGGKEKISARDYAEVTRRRTDEGDGCLHSRRHEQATE